MKGIERKRGKVRCRGFYNASDSAYEFRTPLACAGIGRDDKGTGLVRCEDMESVEGECRYTVQLMVC